MALHIIMIGVQGAGKGTQAAYLKEKFSIPHISTGDLFRAMKTQETPLAKEVQALMRDGKLIPDDVTNRIVQERLKEADAQNGAIFDGYPRTPAQAQALDAMLAARGHHIDAVLVMELHPDIAVMRAEGRRYSQDKQRIYNIYFAQPQNKKDGVWLDDIDGQPLIQRDDDHRDAVRARIDTYFEQTAPLIDYYEAKGRVHRIDAAQPIDAVQNTILAALDAIQTG